MAAWGRQPVLKQASRFWMEELLAGLRVQLCPLLRLSGSPVRLSRPSS